MIRCLVRTSHFDPSSTPIVSVTRSTNRGNDTSYSSEETRETARTLRGKKKEKREVESRRASFRELTRLASPRGLDNNRNNYTVRTIIGWRERGGRRANNERAASYFHEMSHQIMAGCESRKRICVRVLAPSEIAGPDRRLPFLFDSIPDRCARLRTSRRPIGSA